MLWYREEALNNACLSISYITYDALKNNQAYTLNHDGRFFKFGDLFNSSHTVMPTLVIQFKNVHKIT